MSNYRDYHSMLIERLKDRQEAQAYLDIAISEFVEDHDKAAFLQALRAIAEAQGGLGMLAERSNLNRQNLYKALSEKGNPKLDTIGGIMKNLGFRLSVELTSDTPQAYQSQNKMRFGKQKFEVQTL